MENSTLVCFETIPVFIVVTPVTQLEGAVLAKHPHFFQSFNVTTQVYSIIEKSKTSW